MPRMASRQPKPIARIGHNHNIKVIQMNYTITKQYENLPTDAAREAVAIMAKDRKTYAGEFAHHAEALRGIRSALQCFEGVFSQYVEDNGEVPTKGLLGQVNDQFIDATLHDQLLGDALECAVDDDFADFSGDYDLAIEAYDKAAAFILSIAGCSHEERLEQLTKLRQVWPLFSAEYRPEPKRSEFESELAFSSEWDMWLEDRTRYPMGFFLGDLLHELENIASHPVERSPLAPKHFEDYIDLNVAELVAGILDNSELFWEATAKVEELERAADAKRKRRIADLRETRISYDDIPF